MGQLDNGYVYHTQSPQLFKAEFYTAHRKSHAHSHTTKEGVCISLKAGPQTNLKGSLQTITYPPTRK